MSSSLERALDALLRVASLPRDDVERVELGKDGRLILTVGGREPTRWFAHGAQGLDELHPAQERRIPFCRTLDLGACTVLAWRPGRRITCRRDEPTGSVAIKGLRRGRWERAADALDRARVLERISPGFRVPRVMVRSADSAAFTATWIDGEPLEIGRRDAEVFELTGRCLYVMQTGLPLDGLPRHEPSDELDVLDGLRRRLAPVLGELPRGWLRAHERLARCAPPTALPPVAVHRDLHDGQLLRTDDGVGLLDFDLLCAGSPAIDPANLTVHLRLRALQRIRGADEHGADACARAFLEGFAPATEPGFVDHLRYYQAATFLRLALLYALRPRWRHLAAELVLYGERCLDETPV